MNQPQKRSRSHYRSLKRSKRFSRLSRLETLEARVVLDGNGLGDIAPNSAAQIPLGPVLDTTILSYSPELGVSRDIDVNATLLVEGNAQHTGNAIGLADVLEVFIQGAPAIQPIHNQGAQFVFGGQGEVIGRGELDASGQLRADGSGVTRADPDVLTRGDLSAVGSFAGVVYFQYAVSEGHPVVSTGMDPGALAIELPPPNHGFLPVGNTPVVDSLSTFRTYVSAPATESDHVAGSRDSAGDIAAAQSSESAGDERADPDDRQRRTSTLSRDRYFATTSAMPTREQVRWSTNTSASESRQQIASFDANTASNERSNSILGYVAAMSSVAAPELAMNLIDTAVFSLWSLNDEGQTINSPNAQALAMSPSMAMLTPTSSGEIVSAQNQPQHETVQGSNQSIVFDHVFKRYRPLSLLVGVSLVSAHLISDSRRQAEEKERGKQRRL